MPKAFISYARDGSHGENLASEVQQQLLAAGYEVFRDVIGLKPGDVWYHKLEFELDSSDVLVLVVSEKARTSKWVHNEVSMAEEIGIPVIPLLAERVRHPLWLRHLQVLDFCGVRDWALLVGAVAHRVGMPVARKENPPPTPPFAKEGSVAVTPVIATRSTPASPFAKGGLRGISRPAWASTAGDDNYGSYADLEVCGVVQRFRWIEPGTFWMGSPDNEPGRRANETRHQVKLTKGYWLADTACTQALWQQVMGSNPSHFKDNADNPVEQISWEDTQQFFEALNFQVPELNLCLPSEAEWEYACRAGSVTPYSFGQSINAQQANFGQNIGQTVPVESLPANAWGLYQMHGNVWEWCNDGYGDYPKGSVSDPKGSDGGSYRVLRGGSWNNDPQNLRSANRNGAAPGNRGSSIGFRPAQVKEQ